MWAEPWGEEGIFQLMPRRGSVGHKNAAWGPYLCTLLHSGRVGELLTTTLLCHLTLMWWGGPPRTVDGCDSKQLAISDLLTKPLLTRGREGLAKGRPSAWVQGPTPPNNTTYLSNPSCVTSFPGDRYMRIWMETRQKELSVPERKMV